MSDDKRDAMAEHVEGKKAVLSSDLRALARENPVLARLIREELRAAAGVIGSELCRPGPPLDNTRGDLLVDVFGGTQALANSQRTKDRAEAVAKGIGGVILAIVSSKLG